MSRVDPVRYPIAPRQGAQYHTIAAVAIKGYGPLCTYWPGSSYSRTWIELLLEAGADVHAVNNFGETTLSLVAKYHMDKPQCGAVATLLIRAGARSDHIDHEGKSPVSLAGAASETEVARAILA